MIHDGDVRDATENRLAMTIAQLKEAGVEATGEVMDPDPYSAIMDALGEEDYDEIIISTHPETRSGWLRQDLVTRVEQASRRPVEHVVVDLDADKADAVRTLVVANQTVGGEPLIEQLKELAEEGERRFIVISPQSGRGRGRRSAAPGPHARAPREGGPEGDRAGHPPRPLHGDPERHDFYGIDEIVISTFPETRSGWLRADLVGRVQTSTGKPVHHVVSDNGEG